MKRGLTLIEVLLAIAILGSGIVALLTASGRCVAIMRRAADFELVRSAFGEAETEFPLDRTKDLKEQSVASHSYGGCTFTRLVEDDDDEDGLYLVRERVTWPGREGYEEAVRYVYEPDNDKAR